jgi:hypothetical protein
MPAIQIARIRRQAAQLAEHFSQPEVFVHKLKDLFEFYGSPSHHSSQVGAPPLTLPAYNVPDPVIRRILLELEGHAEAEPEKALALADALWEKATLEFRLLAAKLVGKIPAAKHKRIIKRLNTWNDKNQEETLLETLANEGTASLRAEASEVFILHIETWLGKRKINPRKLGLRALLAQLTDTGFQNLPLVYRLLEISIQGAPKELRPYLLDLIQPLAQRSPLETAYFLRQNLATSSNPMIPWLIRRSLKSFPDDVKENLRGAIKR